MFVLKQIKSYTRTLPLTSQAVYDDRAKIDRMEMEYNEQFNCVLDFTNLSSGSSSKKVNFTEYVKTG